MGQWWRDILKITSGEEKQQQKSESCLTDDLEMRQYNRLIVLEEISARRTRGKLRIHHVRPDNYDATYQKRTSYSQV